MDWAEEGAAQADFHFKVAMANRKTVKKGGRCLKFCEMCDLEIIEARRKTAPGGRLCADSQMTLKSGQGGVDHTNVWSTNNPSRY